MSPTGKSSRRPRRVLRLLTAAAAATALLLSGCGGGGSGGSGTASSEISVGYAYAPETFDPMFAIAGAQASAHMHAIYGALIERDAQGVERPGMAKSFEWTTPTSLVFNLRPDVKFTDGEAFNAAAVKKWLDYGRTAPNKPYDNLSAVKNVVAVDDLTVKLELSRPDPRLTKFFVGHMGSVPSPKALDSGKLNIEPVGAGPYTLVPGETVVDNTYTYKKNPDYWDAGRFDFDTLVIKIYADANAMYNALVSGQVDVGYGNGSNYASADSSDLSILSKPQNANGISLWDLTGANVPALGEQKVRQAMNLAVDRKTLIDTVFQGQGVPSALSFTPGSGAAYDESLLDYYGYDPAKAKQLLSEAGYPQGFSFEAVTLPKDQPMAEAVAGYLEAIGVTMKLVVRAPGETANTDIGKYDAAASALGLADAYAAVQNLYLGPATATNQRGYEVPEIRSLYDQMVNSQGAEQDALMKQIAKVAVEGAYSVQVGYVNSLTYYDGEKVKDVMVLPGHGGPYLLEGLRRASAS